MKEFVVRIYFHHGYRGPETMVFHHIRMSKQTNLVVAGIPILSLQDVNGTYYGYPLDTISRFEIEEVTEDAE